MKKLKKMPSVKSAMTPFPHSIQMNAPLDIARKLMREHHIHHLPVTDKTGLIGIITDRDIKLILGPEFDYPPERELTVEDVYIPNAYIIDLTTPLDHVLVTMASRHIGSAIVTKKGKLVGVFTHEDACNNFAHFLRDQFPASGGNEVA